MIFQAEAEVRWLDHCEARLPARPRPSATTPCRGDAGAAADARRAAKGPRR